MTLLHVEQLGKVYDPSPIWLRLLVRSSTDVPVAALSEVTFSLGRGQILAVVGPNGAGKSTLFRTITGLTTPTTGSVQVNGHDASAESLTVRRMIGFMPADDRSLLLRQSCLENLEFHGRLFGMSGIEIARRTKEVLDLVNLWDARGRAAIALSSGMRARLQLGRALLHKPQLLVLDEPTGTIDPVSAHSLLAVVRRIAEADEMAVLISSHRLEEIEALGENVLLMHHGRIVHKGSLSDLRVQLGDVRRIQLVFRSEHGAKAGRAVLKSVNGLEMISTGPNDIIVSTSGDMGQLLHALGSGSEELESVTFLETPLRDLFTKTFGDEP